MKVNDIIFKYLEHVTKNGSKTVNVPSWQIEQDMMTYGYIHHGTQHTASTYSRAFRKFREQGLAKKKNFTIQDVTHTGVRYKTWRIQPISKSPSVPAPGTP